ncbi:transposase [Streptomyces avidinii]|uniref:Transposase n=1 Tax=Streptomyces avidinii TaxID=1895 RepID=A0ABS4L5B7_STRAV|nr:transposase [Streptomyces avidinii]
MHEPQPEQDFLRRVAVGHVGRGDHDEQRQAFRVHDQVAFAAIDLLRRVVAASTSSSTPPPGIDMHIVRRDPTTRGFTVLPRRWTVERTLGWLMNHRRLARDYEAHPHRSEAMIHLAMINLMTRRLTSESTPTWRGA